MQSSVEALRSKLAERKGSWPALAEASGVPISTLRKVAQGVIKNPGIETFDRLNRALDQPEPGRAAA
jgi:transcriptional regulator with XRE-family HTH domain